MSRLSKKPIVIPAGIEAEILQGTIRIKGPKGELSFTFHPAIEVLKENKKIKIKTKILTKKTKSLLGLSARMICAMIEGVIKRYEKQLIIEGVGYKANVEGEDLILETGFSHKVKMKIPEGLKITVAKNVISILGADKQVVGEFAAIIKKIKPPEPYKGKGIRYVNEKIKKKFSKKATAAASAA